MDRSSDQPIQLTRGYTIALLSAAILSTTSVIIRYLTQNYQVPALVLAFWRDVFVALTLIPVLAVFKPRLLGVPRRQWGFLVGYGLVMALFNSLWTLSVAINGAAVATVLVYCSTAFGALLGWWLLRERLSWFKLVAVAACLGGCVLVSGALETAGWSARLIGVVCGVLAGLAYAGYTLMGRFSAQRGNNPWTATLYAFSIATLFLLAFNLLPGGPLPGAAARPADLFWLGSAWKGWALLILLSAGPTVMGFGLVNVSLLYLPSSVANLILTMEPVFTLVIAYLALGERLSLVQLAGSLLILGGVVFLRVYEGWVNGKQKETAPTQA